MKQVDSRGYKKALSKLRLDSELPFNEHVKPTIKSKIAEKPLPIPLPFRKVKSAAGKTKRIAKKLSRITPEHLRLSKKYKITTQEARILSGLSFRKNPKPQVSIIIPVYNKLGITIRCLSSIARHKTSHKIEVIVVDNGSKQEPVSQCLADIKGLRLVSNKENLGYVGGCNSGAETAKGNILIILNNDTEVQDNWLDSLVAQLDNPDVGLVGSKLIYPDGKLQEAGGVIFNDASGNNYGKWQDSGNFRYNYTTEVDYVSGASIAITKKLFKSFGGFDDLYAPAYYEDTDLAFKVRSKGLKVLYEPKSVVVHIEGATAGTDTSSGFKKYQVINQEKFKKRWAKELRRQPDPKENLFAARTHRYQEKILFIDNSVPEPDKDSGSVREWEMLTIMRDLGCHVTFWAANLVATLPYTSQLQDLGIEVVYGDKEDANFEKVMKERQDCYTHVLVARPFVASRFLDSAKKYQPHAKIIYDTVDLHYLRTERQAEAEKNSKLLKQAEEWKTVERYLIEQSDTTLVVSPVEKDILEKMGYNNISILSNIHKQRSLKCAPSFDYRSNLLFIGNFHHTPNIDAMVWFCKHIFPKIRKQIPGVNLTIVGSNPNASVKKLGDIDGVGVTGYVENVEPIFDKTRVFISPLRYGAGVKGKLGQSISLGLPIVTTSIGSEGMYLKNDHDCLIADDEDSFVRAVVQLYNNKKLWISLQKNAQKTIDKHLSHQAAERAITRILHQ